MSIYCDASVLLKRVLDEPDAAATTSQLRRHAADGKSLLTTSLARVEIGRAIRRVGGSAIDEAAITDLTARALRGIDTQMVDNETLAIASTLPAQHLGALDAIHVATALMVGADVVLTRDRRMAEACTALGLAVA